MHAPRKVPGLYSGQYTRVTQVLPGHRCRIRQWRAVVCSLHRVEHGTATPGTTPLVGLEAQHVRWGVSSSPALLHPPNTSSPNVAATMHSNSIRPQLTAASISQPQADMLLAHQGTAAVEAATAAVVSAAAAGQRVMMHIHAPFMALFVYLSILGVLAESSDWYLDIACFGAAWACLWAACCKLRPSARTVVLLNFLPVMHMAGALGLYHWELGNLSWDIIVHISNGFIGTLLFAACLSDMAAAAAPATQQTMPAAQECYTPTVQQQQQQEHSWRHRAWGVLQLSALLIVGTSLIEVLEAYGGQVAGSGEGIFLRGAGDFCTATLPCTEDVDTAKDMVDNVVGMALALVALATGKSSHSKV